MAHEIENMFSVSETPWHGLGVIIKDAPNTAEVLKLAGLDWTVSMRELFLGNGTKVSERAICRDSDNSVLGFAGPRYTPFQNQDALDFFKAFSESGIVSFETAGSLRQGQRVWILARIKDNAEIEIAPGDAVRKYLMLSNGHDGVTGIRVGFTPIRIVCANTLALAHSNSESKLLRVFHSKNVKQNVDLIRETIKAADGIFQATAEQYRQLTRIEVNQDDIKKYVQVVFYADRPAETEREKTLRQNMESNIVRLFETGKGNSLPGVKGTAWALYNATTEFLNYEQGRSQDTRLNNLWFGRSIETNKKALETALTIKQAA